MLSLRFQHTLKSKKRFATLNTYKKAFKAILWVPVRVPQRVGRPWAEGGVTVMASSRQLPASGLVLFGWAILRVSKSSLSWQIAGKWAVKKCQPADFNNMYHHWTWWTLCCIGRSDLVHCWQWGKMDWWCTYNFGWHPHYHRFSCCKCQVFFFEHCVRRYYLLKYTANAKSRSAVAIICSQGLSAFWWSHASSFHGRVGNGRALSWNRMINDQENKKGIKLTRKSTYMFGNLMTEKMENLASFSAAFAAAARAKIVKKIAHCCCMV